MIAIAGVPRNTKAMQERRARVLEAARAIILAAGVRGLTVRRLAQRAGVSLPTVYRLVGSREQVLTALFVEAQARTFAAIERGAVGDPLTILEAVPIETVRIYRTDEAYFKAGFLAMESLDEGRRGIGSVSDVYRRGQRIVTEAFANCIEEGQLTGRLPAPVLGKLTMHAYRFTWVQWARSQISLDQVLREALTHLYVTLLADAGEELRMTVLGRLAALGIGAASNDPPGESLGTRSDSFSAAI